MTEPDPQNPPTPTPKVEFTAEQHEAINAIVAGKVAEAQRKAARDKQAEIDEYLAEQKAQQDREKLDEVDRLKAEKADAEAKAAQAVADAQAIKDRATATTAFLAAGGNPANVDDALRLINTSADDLTAEITGLADRLPALFTEAGDPTPPATPFGGDRGRGKPPAAKDANDRARSYLRNAGIPVPDNAA